MRHKVSIKMDFILEREEDLGSFDAIALAMREAFSNLESHERKNFKFKLDIESIPYKLEDIKL